MICNWIWIQRNMDCMTKITIDARELEKKKQFIRMGIVSILDYFFFEINAAVVNKVYWNTLK